MFRANVFICILFCTFLTSLTPVTSGDIIVVPGSPYMGMNPTMVPVNQLSGDHLVWTDITGIKLFNGLETILLSYDSMAASMISEKNVAWRGSMSGRIYFWDGLYIRAVPRLYAGPAGPGAIALSGSNVAWLDNDPVGMCQLFMWNGTQTLQLSVMSVDCMQTPQISGSNAVWTEYAPDSGQKLFVWNGTERLEIASGMFDPMCLPKISGSNVAWKQHDAGLTCEQVFFWNGTEAAQITNYSSETPPMIYNVKISGNTVAWLTMDGLYCWNGVDIKQLAGGSDPMFECPSFEVSGSYVAWHQRKDGFDKLFIYDGTGTVQITEPGIQILTAPMPGSSFMMSQSNIAWIQQAEDTRQQVYFWNGHTTTPLGDITTSGMIVTLVGVSGKNVAWYADGAIFLSRQIPESCQEALAMGYSIVSDLNRDCKVNLSDVAILSEDWLRSIDPADASHEMPWAD